MNSLPGRKLDNVERQMVERINRCTVDRFGVMAYLVNLESHVVYTVQGNFCCATVFTPDGAIWNGVSKRKPTDKLNWEAGFRKAFERAFYNQPTATFSHLGKRCPGGEPI